jgi:hypothetical protein
MGEMANREREARTNLEETRFYVIFIVRYRPVTTGKQSRLGIHCSSACQRGKFGGKAGWKGPAPHGVASKAVKVSISKQSPCRSLWATAFKVGYPWPKGAGRQEHEVVLGDYLGNSGYWNHDFMGAVHESGFRGSMGTESLHFPHQVPAGTPIGWPRP